MILTACAITGADNYVDPVDLARISEKFPFVEWGIPDWPEQRGEPRYPTLDWVKRFHQVCPDVRKSTHLRDQALIDLAHGNSDFLHRLDAFPRVQLNFSSETPHIVNAIARQVERRQDQEFIFQYNSRTQHLLPAFQNCRNLEILFDTSAGTGQSPEEWPNPLPGYFCGYAGGIGPDNFDKVLHRIAKNLPKGMFTWTDMETKVRTDNRLSLGKVRTVLEIARPFTKSHGMRSELVPRELIT